MAPRRLPYLDTLVLRKQVLEDRTEGSKQRKANSIARGIGHGISQGTRDAIARGMQEVKGNLARLRPHSDVVCSNLCERCSKIPWVELVTAGDEVKFQLIGMTKPLEELQVSACPSCRILGSNLPSFDVTFLSMEDRYYLRFRDKHDKYWYPSSLRIIHKENPSLLDRSSAFIDKRGYVNALEMKGRIEDCIDNHKQCRPQPCDSLRDLKVIDCYERTVVLAPESCRFVALSYVWGRPTQEAESIDRPQFPMLLDVFHRTVEDSIVTTIALGFQYLWVDRYCIDQHNADDQSHQINQMGAIYSSAQVTLIAAAGTDANFGLPGISREFSYPESCSVTKNLCLVNASQSVTRSVSASTWLSRAWTLQEGYLSKRRLFFVEHGIEYICDQYLQTGKRLWTPIASELTASLPSKIDHWDRASHMMRQFTGRSLTYEDDALNAIIGALETLESIDHTEGVIIQLSNSSDISSIYMALDWYHNLPCPRRKRFPSWSPLGWQGKIDYLDYKASISSDCSLEVWHDGEMRHVSHAFGKLSEGHRSPRPAEARLLRLSTTVVMLDFEYLDHDSSVPAGLYVKVPYAPELDLFVLPLWDAENVQDMQEDSLQLPCAVATRRRTLTDTTWRCEQESQILIMRQFGTHCERIGCFNLHWGYRTIYARDKQGRIFLLDFAYGNPLVEYGDGTFWKKHGEERTFLLG